MYFCYFRDFVWHRERCVRRQGSDYGARQFMCYRKWPSFEKSLRPWYAFLYIGDATHAPPLGWLRCALCVLNVDASKQLCAKRTLGSHIAPTFRGLIVHLFNYIILLGYRFNVTVTEMENVNRLISSVHDLVPEAVVTASNAGNVTFGVPLTSRYVNNHCISIDRMRPVCWCAHIGCAKRALALCLSSHVILLCEAHVWAWLMIPLQR